MDLGGLAFFGFLGAIIIVPQVLRHQERGRLHETLRLAFERGQPVPPELFAALQGRRRYVDSYALPPEVAAGWRPRPAQGPIPAAGAPETTSQHGGGPQMPGPESNGSEAASPAMAARPAFDALFPSQSQRDLRRGLIWLAVGAGLVAAGGAAYAGLYDVGGAEETLSLFVAFGAIPIFVGLTYVALAWFAREKTRG